VGDYDCRGQLNILCQLCKKVLNYDSRAFLKLLQSQKDENWALPILFSVTLDLRLFANSVSVRHLLTFSSFDICGHYVMDRKCSTCSAVFCCQKFTGMYIHCSETFDILVEN